MKKIPLLFVFICFFILLNSQPAKYSIKESIILDEMFDEATNIIIKSFNEIPPNKTEDKENLKQFMDENKSLYPMMIFFGVMSVMITFEEFMVMISLMAVREMIFYKAVMVMIVLVAVSVMIPFPVMMVMIFCLAVTI